ncbi:hypothetical protein Hanom_Chr06g00499891 [Helianthus anomalus]
MYTYAHFYRFWLEYTCFLPESGRNRRFLAVRLGGLAINGLINEKILSYWPTSRRLVTIFTKLIKTITLGCTTPLLYTRGPPVTLQWLHQSLFLSIKTSYGGPYDLALIKRPFSPYHTTRIIHQSVSTV